MIRAPNRLRVHVAAMRSPAPNKANVLGSGIAVVTLESTPTRLSERGSANPEVGRHKTAAPQMRATRSGRVSGPRGVLIMLSVIVGLEKPVWLYAIEQETL